MSHLHDDDRTQPGRELTRSLVLLLATARGLSVANLYYAQPLLHTIARSVLPDSAHQGGGNGSLSLTPGGGQRRPH